MLKFARSELAACCMLVTLSSFLLLPNLGNHYLWQDEAQTTLISQTVLTQGIPFGTDGKNFFSQELGAEYGSDYIYKWHTWFPFYLLAGFFKVFGVSTWSARLPFAIFGIATVVLTYYAAKQISDDKSMATLAALLLLFCVPFLLLARQSRYYSLVIFFPSVALLAYVRMLEKEKMAGLLYLIAVTLTFHSQYVYCAAIAGATLLHSFLFHRNTFLNVLKMNLAVFAINSPWILYSWDIIQQNPYGPETLKFESALMSLRIYINDIFKHLFPPFLSLVPIGFFIHYWVKERSLGFLRGLFITRMVLLIIFTLLTLVILSLTNPAPFFRYLAPLLPVISVFIGAILVLVWRVHFIAALVVFSFLIFRPPFSDYIYEITHDFDGPIKGIVEYLKAHGKDSDTVAITYGDMPLKFYTKMRIIGGLTGEDLTPAKNADWVIIRKHVICEKDFAARSFLLQNVDGRRYQRIELKYPDVPFENREDPNSHRFRTAQNESPVIVFRRIVP